MAKAAIKYSRQQLLEMDMEELVKVYNRQAERMNKNITRAKKAGVNLDIIGGSRRVKRFLHGTGNLTQADIVKMYAANEIRFGGGTIEQKYRRMTEDLAEITGGEPADIRRMLEEDPKKGEEIIDNWRRITDTVAAGGGGERIRDIYYESLRRDVTNMTIKSFSPLDRRGTVYDYDRNDPGQLNSLLEYIRKGVEDGGGYYPV